jgi:hypothetical protein
VFSGDKNVPTRPNGRAAKSSPEDTMLDLVYLIGAVALFAIVALIARGVEKL